MKGEEKENGRPTRKEKKNAVSHTCYITNLFKYALFSSKSGKNLLI